MRGTLRASAALIAAALIAVACGNGDDTGIPSPTATPVGVAATAAANQPVGTTPTASPTRPAPAPEPTVYDYPTGLACYEVGIRSWADPPSRIEAAGFPTLEEAATDWWHNSPEAQVWHQRDGTPSMSAEDLTQSPPSSLPPPRGSAASGINPETAPKSPPVYIYFRDERQHAQIVIAGHQRDDGNWIINSSEHCAYDD